MFSLRLRRILRLYFFHRLDVTEHRRQGLRLRFRFGYRLGRFFFFLGLGLGFRLRLQLGQYDLRLDFIGQRFRNSHRHLPDLALRPGFLFLQGFWRRRFLLWRLFEANGHHRLRRRVLPELKRRPVHTQQQERQDDLHAERNQQRAPQRQRLLLRITGLGPQRAPGYDRAAHRLWMPAALTSFQPSRQCPPTKCPHRGSRPSPGAATATARPCRRPARHRPAFVSSARPASSSVLPV